MENPKIRFKGFTKDWEQRKLGELVRAFNDGSSPNFHDYQDSGIMFLSVRKSLQTLKYRTNIYLKQPLKETIKYILKRVIF